MTDHIIAANDSRFCLQVGPLLLMICFLPQAQHAYTAYNRPAAVRQEPYFSMSPHDCMLQPRLCMTFDVTIHMPSIGQTGFLCLAA